jgi:lipoprotein-releasing system ATP-binding protein
MSQDWRPDKAGEEYGEDLTHIQAKNLRKSFGGKKNRIEVLKGVDLTVKKGEGLGVVGVSGAGKSTLLHILGGLECPTSGKILYNGIDLFSLSEKSLANFRNRKIGFIFQFHHLLSEFSSLENTMMPALIRGVGRKEAKILAEKTLVELGLKERIFHRPGELSGGEAQRVAVARALMLDPMVILADEPTGNLDSRTGEEVGNLLIDLNRRKKITMVIVTHNPKLASKMDRTVGLADGKVKT